MQHPLTLAFLRARISAIVSGIGCPKVSGNLRFNRPEENVRRPSAVNWRLGATSPNIRMNGASIPPILAATDTIPIPEFRIIVGNISPLKYEIIRGNKIQ